MAAFPAQFESYWREVLDALGQLPMAPEISLMPLRTNAVATLYGVRLTSLGPYRIFGYLNIPAGNGPFPAIYFTPRYQSVVQPFPQGTSIEMRQHCIIFALAARGQRNSDKPFTAEFPGWLTTGIHDPATYIFRGVVADCVRGLEFLTGRDDVDAARVAVVGNDLAFITAALGKGATHVASEPELFLGAPPPNAAYPRAEIADLLRQRPMDIDDIRQTLALYDLRAFAQSVAAKRLILAGPTGSPLDARVLAPLADAACATLHESKQSQYKDGSALLSWLASQFGTPRLAALLPRAWR
jgi:cephalosporin-C deacetylase-like acetyl esterase